MLKTFNQDPLSLKIKRFLSNELIQIVCICNYCPQNCCQHFLQDKTSIIKHEFWKKPFQGRNACLLDVPQRLHNGVGSGRKQKFIMMQGQDICDMALFTIVGIGLLT
jgi:hypothetical protein